MKIKLVQKMKGQKHFDPERNKNIQKQQFTNIKQNTNSETKNDPRITPTGSNQIFSTDCMLLPSNIW